MRRLQKFSRYRAGEKNCGESTSGSGRDSGTTFSLLVLMRGVGFGLTGSRGWDKTKSGSWEVRRHRSVACIGDGSKRDGKTAIGVLLQ